MVRPYRGVSAEARREQRRAQLLEACLDVVDSVGVAAATAEAVCAQAGLSKRYFYESFADREEVLVAALDIVFDTVRTAITAALADTDEAFEGRIRRTVAALVGTFSEDRRAARLYVEAARYPALERRRDQAFDEFTQLLLEQVFEVGADGPRARASVLLVVAGTTEVFGRWLTGDIPLNGDDMIETVGQVGIAVAAAQRALTTPDSGRRSPS